MSASRSPQDVEEFWTSHAATFDESADHGLTDPLVSAAWQKHLTSWLPDEPGRLADLGCGTGSLSLLAAQRGFVVDGIDLSPAMVQIARDKASAAGLEEAHFKVGDASAPELEPTLFDVVLTRHVLWTLPNPLSTLAHWANLLVPDGRAILIEGVWGKPPLEKAFPWDGGVSAETLHAAVEPLFEKVTYFPLSNENELWGQEVHDERYAIVAETPVS